MADCLSVLREYRMTKKPIKVEDDLVIFGDKAWPKDTKTNYIRYDANSGQVEYYTLYSLVDFLENIKLPHPLYVKESSAKQIPVVRLPDRKDLEQYLEGITSSSASIDRTAPIQIAIPRGEKRLAALSSRNSDAKKAKHDSSFGGKSSKDEDASGTGQVSSLTEAIPQEKLQELIEKRKAVIRKSTKPVIPEDFVAPPNLVENKLGMSGEEAIKYITSKERVWRTRCSILQSTGSKLIGQNVSLILQSVRALHGGSGGVQMPGKNLESAKEQQIREKQNVPTHYNRYDQEKFKGREDTEGFKIDTMGTYHGLSLKSVNQSSQKQNPTSQSYSSSRSLSSGSGSAPQKRVSKTPIIILPGGSSSLITIFNAKDILQDLRFVSSEQKRQEGTRRDAEVLLHRSKTMSGQVVSVPYRVVDLPSKLTMEEWDRVVACFVQGPAWQFKGWPWLAPDGSPTEIFLHMRAFHMQWDDLPIDKNVQKWDVHILKLSRNHRHLDRAVILKFWENLDRWVGKHKPNLRT